MKIDEEALSIDVSPPVWLPFCAFGRDVYAVDSQGQIVKIDQRTQEQRDYDEALEYLDRFLKGETP